MVYTRQATLTTSSDLKEQWVCNIVASIRHHLKDVKKGWFNLEEVSGGHGGTSRTFVDDATVLQ